MYSILVIFVWAPCIVSGVRIIWDNDASYESNEIVNSRIGLNEEVKMPNRYMIYPGTKWCGAGNIATDYEDLGQFADTDRCCRTHDHCDEVIEGFQTKYNLTNSAFYSRLSCGCDEEFYNCLKTVNSRVSSQVGYLYFNVLGTQCFKLAYPIIKCSKYATLPIRKCLEYEFDESMEPLLQWFDVPIY